MKKLISYLMLFFILFPSFIVPINAQTFEQGMIVTPDRAGVHVRKGPGVNYARVGGRDDGQYVTIIGEDATNDGSTGCPSAIWYKIKFNTDDGYGYVCSDFVKEVEIIENPKYNYEEELEKFPAEFKSYIEKLHKIYPNAIFQAVYATNSKNENSTKMTFRQAIENELTLGKNLVEDPNGTRDGLKNLNSYFYDTNSFDNGYRGGGANWYAASEELIAYYLDSRNFLTEESIFMFQSLSYDPSFHNINGVETILSGSYMANAYVDGGVSKLTFSEVIMQAGIEASVSPYFLAGRIIQEVGYKRSSLVKGTYPDYPQFNGYYNYYNIGATGNINEIVVNGLTRAKAEGWNSEEKAIKGGAKKIGNDYILVGQDTLYFQKWDVQCSNKNGCFYFQYMQNLEAPYTESKKTYNAYDKSMGASKNLLPYFFRIPVYEDMPMQLSPKPNAASPIAYLNSITINGKALSNFYGLTHEYSYSVPAGTTSIVVEATAIASNKGAKVEGTGNIMINSDEQDVILKGIAANGNKESYTIHIKRLKPEESSMTLEETLQKIESAAVKENYISGLTSVDTMKAAILKANPAALVTIKNLEGKAITSGNLGTGYTVSITVGNETKVLEYILYGDTNGDSEITILDLLRVQKQLLKAIELTGSQYQACDVNRDGNIDVLDLLLVQKHLLGEKYISQ